MTLKYINNPNFIKWCNWPITKLSILDKINKTNKEEFEICKKEERLFWNSLIWEENNWQWTTKLCEWAVKELLQELWYKNVKKARTIKSTTLNKSYNPDFESDDYVWEVKWSNWTISWTAWEKILGTPLKYSEIPQLYWKPLLIVCLWYQEYEARNWFAWGNLIETNKRGNGNFIDIINKFNELDIKYIWYTDLLNELENKK